VPEPPKSAIAKTRGFSPVFRPFVGSRIRGRVFQRMAGNVHFFHGEMGVEFTRRGIDGLTDSLACPSLLTLPLMLEYLPNPKTRPENPKLPENPLCVQIVDQAGARRPVRGMRGRFTGVLRRDQGLRGV
jgi:hypothetical protein